MNTHELVNINPCGHRCLLFGLIILWISTCILASRITRHQSSLPSNYICALKYMITPWCGNTFLITDPLWIYRSPQQRASSEELWCFLWSYPKQVFQQTVQLSSIWDTLTLIWRHWHGCICFDYIMSIPMYTCVSHYTRSIKSTIELLLT